MGMQPIPRKAVLHLLNLKGLTKNTDTGLYTYDYKESYWTTDAPDLRLINEGVTELTEEFNPDTEDTQYVAEKNGSTFIKKYRPSLSLTTLLVIGEDEVNQFLRLMTNILPIGTKAQIDYVRFCILDAIDNATKDANGNPNGTYAAQRCRANITVGSIGGSAGDNVSTSATINANGDPVQGFVTVSTTPNVTDTISSLTYTWSKEKPTTSGN